MPNATKQESGRESTRMFDAEVASKIMEWKLCAVSNMPWQMQEPGTDYVRSVPRYSLEIAPAMDVVEKMRERGYFMRLEAWGQLHAYALNFDTHKASGGCQFGQFFADELEALPMAICKAALACVDSEATNG